ncbi:TPA: hypothetical protein DCZ39_01005 [Patescibacteria group bacterium]|nr:hypothetical protein [Candidatus Gracilibacteria bacterium]
MLTTASNQFPIVNQVSRIPPVLRRTILFATTQLYDVKFHPTNIFPPLWITRVLMILLNHHQISKEVSMVPSVFRRRSLFLVVQLYFAKSPPTRIFPPLWIVIALTAPSNQTPIVNQVSTVPLALRRIILLIFTQL